MILRLPNATLKYDPKNEADTRRTLERAFAEIESTVSPVIAGSGVFYNVSTYGAAGDGVTDDTLAIQATIDAAVAAGGGVIYFGPGIYVVSSAITLTEVRDIAMLGAGRYSTIIRQVTANTPTLQANGLWFSRFEGIRFETTATQTNNAVVELDGNYDGTHTLGVQGNTFKDCYFVAGSYAKYAVAVVRQGVGSGQGSENIFLNCHFEGGTSACYAQFGLNALNNTFIGGNFQAYPKDGIYALGGLNVVSVGFQSTYGYTQIVNGGWDINIANGGSGDRIIIEGCRSESLRFCNNAASQIANIKSFTHIPSVANWSDLSGSPAVDTIVSGTTASGERKLYRITTSGALGGAEPVWPDTGTVADGSAVWTLTNFNVIETLGGLVDQSYIQLGQVAGDDLSEFRSCYFRRKDVFPSGYFTTDGYNPIVTNCFYADVGGSAETLTWGNQTTTINKITQNIGNNALASISGSGGGTHKPIALYRGHGNFNYPVLNWWEIVGGMKHQSFTFADMANATAANGVVDGLMVFVSDGTPGDPLTGSGTGCFAYYANGRWKGL